jgi:hypothetical protein
MPTPSLRHALILSTFAALSAVSGLASAADLQRVEVSGRNAASEPRTDVRRVCPGLDAQLLRSLTPTLFNVQRDSVVTVNFRLNGPQMQQLQATGGLYEHRSAVRRAVSSLDCQAESGQSQRFVMQVVFRMEEEQASGESRRVIALLD